MNLVLIASISLEKSVFKETLALSFSKSTFKPFFLAIPAISSAGLPTSEFPFLSASLIFSVIVTS